MDVISLGEATKAVEARFTLAFEAALNRFLCARQAEGSSPNTLRVLRRSLTDLFSFLLGEHVLRSVADVTAEHLIAYRDLLLTREKRPTCPEAKASGLLAASSVRQQLWAVKDFFRFLLEREEIFLDPARLLRPPRLPRRLPRDVPSVPEMRRLLRRATSRKHGLAVRDAAILELLYGTGLRNAELCGLLLEDFQQDASALFVRNGKGGKDRVLPVGQKAAQALSRYLPQRPGGEKSGKEPLFLTRRGTPLRPAYVRALVRRAAKQIGLQKRVTPHSLRHACATHLLKGQADIRKIQVLLGHASLATTEIYTRVDTSDLKRVLARCHPREISPL